MQSGVELWYNRGDAARMVTYTILIAVTGRHLHHVP
jgi:hypothetical protein